MTAHIARTPEARVDHPVAGIRKLRRPRSWAQHVVRVKFPNGHIVVVGTWTYAGAWNVLDRFVAGEGIQRRAGE